MFIKNACKLTTVCCALSLIAFFAQPAMGYKFFTSQNNVPFKWSSPTIAWQLQDGAPPLVRESMLEVAKAWSEATNGYLKFVEAPGGITIEWDPAGAHLIDGSYLGYTTFNAGASAHILSAHIVINAQNYIWHRGGYTGVGASINNCRDANLDSVLMHEVGHALGLDHCDSSLETIVGNYSSSDSPTMWSVVYAGANTLHIDDETGIRSLYPASNALAGPPPFSFAASPAAGRVPLTPLFTPNGGETDVLWDFGDGMSAQGGAQTHRYKTPGYYTVTATCNGQTSTFVIEADQKNGKAPKIKKPKTVKIRRPKSTGYGG